MFRLLKLTIQMAITVCCVSAFAGDISDMAKGERTMRLVIQNHAHLGNLVTVQTSEPGSGKWGKNLLKRDGKIDAIAPGSDRFFRLDEDAFTTCAVDFQGTFADGSTQLKKGVNACTVEFLIFE